MARSCARTQTLPYRLMIVENRMSGIIERIGPSELGEPINARRQRFRHHPEQSRRTAQRAAIAAIALLASIATATGQAAPPDRARTLAAIEAYRGIRQKFERSTGPLADYAGFYSRGGRCEFNQRTAARPPGMWEKTQYAVWFDDKYLYGMTLDASPAVFQFEYRSVPNRFGWGIYQMTRVDKLGAAAGIDDSEWKLLVFDGAHEIGGPDIGLRLPADFATNPNVTIIGHATGCGRGDDGMDPILDRANPMYFSMQFLRHRLASMPAP